MFLFLYFILILIATYESNSHNFTVHCLKDLTSDYLSVRFLAEERRRNNWEKEERKEEEKEKRQGRDGFKTICLIYALILYCLIYQN